MAPSLAGLGVGGVVGGITDALIRTGIPEYKAKRNEGRLTRGSILVSVYYHNPEEIAYAREVTECTGEDDILSCRRAHVGYQGDQCSHPDLLTSSLISLFFSSPRNTRKSVL
jgi:hypothetical protein